jgi:HNH endonuclease
MSHGALHRVANEAAWRCHYCGCRLHCPLCDPAGIGRPVTRDHVIPRARGGQGRGNLVASCRPCNERKADRLPGDPPKKRRAETPGCHAHRDSRSARRMRPLKPFPNEAIAQAMCTAVNAQKGTDLAPWHCDTCGEWHIALRRDIREPAARGPWPGPRYR